MAFQVLDCDAAVASKLKECGLDPEYWLDKFKDIGIKYAGAMQFIEGDFETYSNMQQLIRFPWERKALRKLLKIEESQPAKEEYEIGDEQMEDMDSLVEQRQKQSKKIIQKLKTLRQQGNIEEIKILQQQLCKIFHISPDSWLPEKESVDEVITKLEVHCNTVSRVLQGGKHQNFKDASVLVNASNGRALQGILLINKIEELVKDRCHLLRTPTKVHFRGASKPSVDIVKHFCMKTEEDTYMKVFNALGLGVSATGKVPVIEGITLSLGGAASTMVQNEEAHGENQQEIYLSTIKQSSLQLAAYTFSESDLILSEDAIHELRKINTLITMFGAYSPNVQSACKNFFYKYGSHISRGPIHFGGVYRWTCSTTEFNQQETDILKDLQSNAVRTQAGVAFMGFGISTKVDISSVKSKYTGSCSVQALAQTCLKVCTTGGPSDITSLPEWKTGLVANRETWCLTDRGTVFVSVWDIIQISHCKELRRLVKVLRKTWESLTGLQAKHDMLTPLYSPEKVLEEVKEWTEQKLVNVDEYLSYLLDVKNDLCHISRNPQAWSEIYLSKPILQKFLKLVIDLQPSNESHGHYIKFLMQQVVEETDLDSLSIRSFPHKKHFSDSLHHSQSISIAQVDCHNFESLVHILMQTVKTLEITEAKHKHYGEATKFRECNKVATINIVLAIHSLRSHLLRESKCKTSYEDIFVVTLVYPYIESDIVYTNQNSPLLLKSLSLSDMEHLTTLLSEQLMIYHQKKETSITVQAYLLHLSLDIYLRNENVSENQISDHMLFIKKVCGSGIQPKISELLSRYQTKDFTPKKCQEILASLMSMKPTHSCLQTQKDSQSIQEILNALGGPTPHKTPETECDGVPVHTLGNTEVKSLFQGLGLSKYYPKKLTLVEALTIKQIHNNRKNFKDSSPLYSLILDKIMAHDYQCRTDFLDRDNINGASDDIHDSIACKQPVHPQDSILAIFHCSDDFLRQDIMARLATCQLAVPFIIPDPFTNKLVLPLWAMRTIIKEWKSITSTGMTQESISVQEHECPIINYRTPIISFIRLGKGIKSKSRLLNAVISDAYFDHFFHRDCSGGRHKQVLGNGLVDMTWYLPEQTTNKGFPDAITFLNLHGDARNHSCQTTYLSQISSMCFILISEEKVDIKCIEIMKQFSSISDGLVVLSESKDVPGEVMKVLPRVKSIDVMANGENEIKRFMQRCIMKKLQDIQPKTVEDCASIIHSNRVWEVREIVIDEDSDEFKESKKLASSLYELIANYRTTNTSKVRQAMLPLQGQELWQEWACKDKEQYRLLHKSSYGVHDYTLMIETQKLEIRRKQLEQMQRLTPFMRSFLTSMLSQDGKIKQHFLQCLKLHLNDYSRRNVRELQNQYKTLCSKLAENETKIQQEERKALKREISEYRLNIVSIQEHICNESFGLHHMIRELGQIYEALEVSQSNDSSVSQLIPKAAAKLLIDGFPLEIMDGSAAHVPVKWIKAVLNQVCSTLDKNPYVFVLSVLGLQSTGKSTLLNTAFGLQFRVGAGRCTRGVFMQLIPISNDFRNELHCDYVLVVDTEGLRTPELDSEQNKKHDNELATFVIGLANITLINIFGEVAGDMNDILQTAVHALIRMRKVCLKPSCLFVHQNTSESWKAKLGRLKFIQMLDSMTKVAALEERCESEFKYFSDVINFNSDEDIHYLPGLWMGNPPMAPLSRGYSENAQNLKCHLLELMKGNAIELSTFENRISDLWNAILHEDFVFSFKNTTEIQAYNLLETQYNIWDWKFRKEMMIWENQAENELSGIELDELEAKVDMLLKANGELQINVENIHNGLMEEMARYFKESKHRDIQAQWRKKFELKLNSLAVELDLHAKKMCRERSSGRKAMDEMDQEYKNRSWIGDQVKDLIVKMKKEQEELKLTLEMKITQCLKQDSLTEKQIKEISEDGILTVEEIRRVLYQGHLTAEEEKIIFERNLYDETTLKEKFDIQWTKLLQKLPKVQTESVYIEREVEDKLLAHVGEKMKNKFIKKLQKKQLRNWGPDLNERLYFTVKDKHVARTFSLQKLSGASELNEQPSIIHVQCVTDNILAKAHNCLTTMCKYTNEFEQNTRPSSYKPHYVHKLLLEIDDAIKEQEAISIFTEKYTLDLYLTICGYAVGCFEMMMDVFRRLNDPCVYLRDEKKPLFLLFKMEYYQLTSESVAVATLCEQFEKCINNQVKRNLGQVLITDMMQNPCFQSKRAFKAKVLIDLGDDLLKYDYLDLSHFFHYISNAEESLKQWLWHYTWLHCEAHETDGQTRLEVLAQNQVSSLIQFLGEKGNEMITTSTRVQQDNSHPILQADTWLKEFVSCTELRRLLGTIRLNTNRYSGRMLDPSRFSKELMDGLENLKSSLYKQFKKVWILEIVSTNAYKIFERKLIGCCEQCPFCKEQCDREKHDDNEKHMVTHHRPDCFGGYKDSKTGTMSLSICPVLIGSDKLRFKSQRDNMKRFRKYKKYQKSFPTWNIPVDYSAKASLYWKWFVGKYHQQIAEYYGGATPEVPPQWQELKWDDVKREISQNFYIQ